MNNIRSIVLGEETGSLGTPLFCYEGTSSLLTICADEQLKDNHLVIPNLLQYIGSVIVLDPTGKYYQTTSAKRKELGHKIIRLDPFGLSGNTSETFNPLDILLHNEPLMHEAATLIAENFFTEQSLKSIFWDNKAKNLLIAVLLYFATVKKEECNLGKVIELLSDEDVVYRLAVITDKYLKSTDPTAKGIFNFLKEGDAARGGILQTVLQSFLFMHSDLVLNSLNSTSFDLQDLLDGNPFTVYITLPVSKSRSHGILAKLWLSSLAFLLQEKECSTKVRTLIMLDSLSIGNQPYLRNIHKYNKAGSNLQLWTFWNNIPEIQDCYPAEWKSFILRHDIIQILTPEVSLKEFSLYFKGVGAKGEILLPNQQFLIAKGRDPLILELFGNKPTHQNPVSNKSLITILSGAAAKLSIQAFNIAEHKGSVVCFSTSTDHFDGTIQYRQKRGTQIIKLDPFNMLGKDNDTFNPLDILSLGNGLINENVYAFIENNFNRDSNDDLFWDRHSKALLAGILQYQIYANKPKVNLNTIKDLLAERKIYDKILVFAEEMKSVELNTEKLLKASVAVKEIVSDKSKNKFVDICESHLGGIDTPYLRHSLSSTSFDLSSIRSGKPFTMYVTLPASKLKSHGILVRLWISSMVQLLSDSEEAFADKVLFVLNHPQYTGDIPFYQLIQSNSKHRNFQLWTFWDSLSQIQKHYPKEWKTIVGSRGIKSFGLQNPVVAEEMSQVFGIPSQKIRNIPANEHLILTESNALLCVKSIT